METNLVCHLLLDVSASMRYGEAHQQKLLFAVRAAMTLGYSIIERNDKVSLALFDDRIRGHVPPGNSLAQLHRLANELELISPIEKTRMAECLTDLTSRMGRRTGDGVQRFSDGSRHA